MEDRWNELVRLGILESNVNKDDFSRECFPKLTEFLARNMPIDSAKDEFTERMRVANPIAVAGVENIQKIMRGYFEAKAKDGWLKRRMSSATKRRICEGVIEELEELKEDCRYRKGHHFVAGLTEVMMRVSSIVIIAHYRNLEVLERGSRMG